MLIISYLGNANYNYSKIYPFTQHNDCNQKATSLSMAVEKLEHSYIVDRI